METGVKSLYDEVMTLKAAIEEAIIRGQESTGGLDDIPGSDSAADEDPAESFVHSGSGIVGSVEDL